MNVAIIQINESGQQVTETVWQQTAGQLIERSEVSLRWHDFDAFVFIGAMGICVRTIAPMVEDKHSDPAVVCINTSGSHVIPVLSGHVGGANDLARRLASALGAEPVVTTQSDNAGLWAIDSLERRFPNWVNLCDDETNQVVYAFVHRKPVALVLAVRDEGTDWLEATCPEHVTIFDEEDWKVEYASRFAAVIAISPFCRQYTDDATPAIYYAPRVLTMGIGLAHQAAPAKEVWTEMEESICRQAEVLPCGIRNVASINIKADEPVIALLKEDSFLNYDFEFYTAQQLADVEVPTPSATVEQHVGTPSVCEAAALLASSHGDLLVTKQKGQQWTYAIAIDRRHLRRKARTGHIEIVGAGPGDPDLISVRGRRFLEEADLILYAGSLVPLRLTECHKPGAVVRSSADMNLEEQFALMQSHYEQGHLIVRLHTGDPCIYGAIQEQMALFDAHRMSYHITPGISSFQAAAAALHSQFTIPERVQTIILTRGEGRTPMPEREQLHRLAQSRSTMCIYLSADIVEHVQAELLQAYPPETPVAACYKLTWPEERIYRGQLKDLTRLVRDHHLTLTTLLVVGDAIDNRVGLSRLYADEFKHLFRH